MATLAVPVVPVGPGRAGSAAVNYNELYNNMIQHDLIMLNQHHTRSPAVMVGSTFQAKRKTWLCGRQRSTGGRAG